MEGFVPKSYSERLLIVLGVCTGLAILTKNFAGQWLQLRSLSGIVLPPEQFPQFDTALRTAMRRETAG